MCARSVVLISAGVVTNDVDEESDMAGTDTTGTVAVRIGNVVA